MPMGLSISPYKWIQYIGYVMGKMPHPENYIAIMDDLLVHSRESDHMDRISDMLKALVEHGLELSPKKCQFFRSELVYMGNTFKTGSNGITITPIKTRTEAILNTPAPTTTEDCKSFCRVVKYVSLFCPQLQQGSQLASCRAVFVLVSMWLPQQHMASIWTPHGIHMETLWCLVETT